MAQVTELSVAAWPGKVHSFVAKTTAVVTICATVEVVENSENKLLFTNSIIYVEVDTENPAAQRFSDEEFRIIDDTGTEETLVIKTDTYISTD